MQVWKIAGVASLLVVGLLMLATGCATMYDDTRGGTPTDGDVPPPTLNVISFNIRYNTPNDGENAWPHRRDAVASMIRFHEADFAGLQEALLGQIEDLESRLPGYDWFGVGRADGATKGEYTPIFYRSDRFELLEHDTFWLSETPNEPGSKSWDTAIERIATWGLFRDRRSGEEFVFLNTHFDHIGTASRANSAQMIVDRVAEFDVPTIVTGDFNITEDRPPYRILTSDGSELRDAFYASQSPHHGPESTWNGFQEIEPDLRIDYIFVSDGLNVLRHGILTEHVDGRFLSDHLPVLAEVRVVGGD